MKKIRLRKISRKVIKVIKTLTLVIIICVNSIIVISQDNKGNIKNAAEFYLQQEQSINAAEFHFTGGE